MVMNNPGWAGWFRKLPKALRVLCVAVAVTVLAAWLAGRLVSDHFGWSQWLQWIPTPAALLAAAGGFTAAFRAGPTPVRRTYRLLAWGASSLAIGAYFVVIEHRFIRTSPSEPPGLRIVHWNMRAHQGTALEKLAEKLIDFDGDLTVVTTAGRAPWQEAIQEWLGPNARPHAIGPFVVLTRQPILERRPILADGGVYIALLRIDGGEAFGRPLTVYLVDLPSDPKQPRGRIARRARRLLDEVGAPPPDVVLGDFNMTRGSAAMRHLFPDLHHAFDEAGRGYGATFPRPAPLYHIDHTLLADGLRATAYELVDPGVGSHLVQIGHVVAR